MSDDPLWKKLADDGLLDGAGASFGGGACCEELLDGAGVLNGAT